MAISAQSPSGELVSVAVLRPVNSLCTNHELQPGPTSVTQFNNSDEIDGAQMLAIYAPLDHATNDDLFQPSHSLGGAIAPSPPNLSISNLGYPSLYGGTNMAGDLHRPKILSQTARGPGTNRAGLASSSHESVSNALALVASPTIAVSSISEETNQMVNGDALVLYNHTESRPNSSAHESLQTPQPSAGADEGCSPGALILYHSRATRRTSPDHESADPTGEYGPGQMNSSQTVNSTRHHDFAPERISDT